MNAREGRPKVNQSIINQSIPSINSIKFKILHNNQHNQAQPPSRRALTSHSHHIHSSTEPPNQHLHPRVQQVPYAASETPSHRLGAAHTMHRHPLTARRK